MGATADPETVGPGVRSAAGVAPTPGPGDDWVLAALVAFDKFAFSTSVLLPESRVSNLL